MPVETTGTIEVVGALGERELFIKGWSRRRFAPGAPILAVGAGKPVPGRLFPVWTDRPDVGPGTGFAALAEFTEQLSSTGLRGIVAKGETSAGALALYEAVTHVEPGAALALLREALERGEAGSARARLALLAARFDGTDSVSSSPLPVRLGMDDCAELPGRGLLLSGWIFDPESLVDGVWLSGGDERHRIDGSWVRRMRPDVAANFAADPRFAGYGSLPGAHGFTALVPDAASAEDLHLTLNVEGATPLHYPLRARSGKPVPLLRGFLRALEPDAPASLDVVDRVLAPALTRLRVGRARRLRVEDQNFGGKAPLALVLGCAGDVDAVADLLPLLARDPVARQTPLVVAGGAGELEAQGGAIRRAATFFDLKLRLVFGRDIEDAEDALLLGAEASEAERICLLTTRLLPASGDWLARLAKAQASAPGSAAVPNVRDVASESPAAAAAAQRRAFDRDRQDVHDCMLLACRALLALGHAPRVFLDPFEKARERSTRLRASGVPVHRVDACEMLTVRDRGGAGPWMRLARRADRAAGVILAGRGAR